MLCHCNCTWWMDWYCDCCRFCGTVELQGGRFSPTWPPRWRFSSCCSTTIHVTSHCSAQLATFAGNWHSLHFNSLEPGSFTFVHLPHCVSLPDKAEFPPLQPTAIKRPSQGLSETPRSNIGNTAMKKCKHTMWVFNKVAWCVYIISFSENLINDLKYKLVCGSVPHYRLIQPGWRSLYSPWTPLPTNLLEETLLLFVHWSMWVVMFKLDHWSFIMQSSLCQCFLKVPALINTSWTCFPEIKVVESTQVSV